jgi:hypothetical protein
MRQRLRNSDGEPLGRPTTRPARLIIAALLPFIFVAVLGLQSCTFAKVETITRNHFNSQRGQPMEFTVTGTGNCTMLSLDWGDGQPPLQANNVDFDANPLGVKFSHPYNGWGGRKTVTAAGVTNCVGAANTQISVVPPFALAFGQPGPTACSVVPNAPTVLAHSTVHITTNPDPQVRINFGCFLGGCVYDADGEPSSVAPAGYPFPGLRKYSLVIRIGNQIVQGGTDVFFTVTQGGPMEVCVNDDVLHDNSGAWGIFIDVNS